MKPARIVFAAVVLACSGLAVAQDAKQPEKKPDEKKVVPATPVQPAPADKDKKEEQKEPTLKVGDKAPAIEVDKFIKGEEVKSFEKGRVYVVEFWATWCGPCKEAIPHLTAMQKKHKDVLFIGVASSEKKPAEGEKDKREENLRQFVKEQGDQMAYRVAYDSKRAMTNLWMTPAGQGTIPTAFIVNGEGKIAWIGHPGEMEGALERVIKATPSGG
jgi:thiol-disulfide isomerase/thioredoxin